MKKMLFIDRDGTIIKEPTDNFQVDRPEKLEFMPGVIGALREITGNTDFRLVMVSNQDGLGTADFPMEDFMLPQTLMLKVLESEGIVFDEICIDTSRPEEYSRFRKPGIGMVEKYLNEYLDTENSYVIGDRETDMQLAAHMGIKGIWLGEWRETDLPVVLHTDSWREITRFIISGSRKVRICRKTAETEVTVTLNLNGEGCCSIKTGLSFFDHMLEQIARHAGVDLEIGVRGDLKVDEHHTVEDTAIVLGECFATALGSKKGIASYGFALPMDDAKAEVLLDFGGRTWLEWGVTLKREYVGDFPTEMARHFFASFCQSGQCNLHISAQGENTHHILEAVFKAFARAVRQAIRQTGGGIPSSKGCLA